MKVGFSAGNIGPIGTAEAIRRISAHAEQLGYHSLWTVERLLYPVEPQSPYPATPDGSLPEPYRYCLDPVDTLTFAAAHTKSIALGTSILDLPYYNPVMLARRLSTLDVFSGGRLRVGFGLGWSQDEMLAAGANMKTRGAQADEFIQVLKSVWTTNPVEFRGRFYQIPRSWIEPKPLQKPHPPIYFAAYAPAAMKRLAEHASGWNPVGIPVEGMLQMWTGIKQLAKDAGRDPSALEMIVRANLEISDAPLPGERAIFTGSLEQIREDTIACRDIGANEIIFDPTFSPGAQSLDTWLRLMEQLRSLV